MSSDFPLIFSSSEPVSYEEAVEWMEQRVHAIIAGQEAECFWFLEHPPLYTAGSSARPGDLLDPSFPVYESTRGGQYTYHGPGQRVIYVLLDLTQRGQDIRQFVQALEMWIILSLKALGIAAFTREGRVGVWVMEQGGERKIASIGVRVRRWVSFHGVALNVSPDLDAFKGIVPCGLKEFGVTSCQALGHDISLLEMDQILQKTLTQIPFFGKKQG